eukprot:2908195-Alexandrium_andersonii.AAC.1
MGIWGRPSCGPWWGSGSTPFAPGSGPSSGWGSSNDKPYTFWKLAVFSPLGTSWSALRVGASAGGSPSPPPSLPRGTLPRLTLGSSPGGTWWRRPA